MGGYVGSAARLHAYRGSSLGSNPNFSQKNKKKISLCTWPSLCLLPRPPRDQESSRTPAEFPKKLCLLFLNPVAKFIVPDCGI